jgi:hypothetical protein
MKTRTTFIISLTAILTLAAGSAFGKYSGGTGEPNTPYQIATKADLLVLAADANDYGKCFILTADINMEGQVFTTAIIAAGYDFKGTFDGNGHKVTHFTINGGSNSFLGLFSSINDKGSVKNLGLENCVVSGYWAVGGLVGWNYGNISHCYSTGSVSGSYEDVGGLVGWNDAGISNCYSTGMVSGSSGSTYIGGLVGENYRDGSISQCYSTGSVNGSSDSWNVGGLVGRNYGGSINQCYATGTVGGNGGVGGLVGENEDLVILNNCYSTGAVSGSSNSRFVGGLVGYNDYRGSISNCYSTGTVSGSSYVGGLFGYGGGSVISSFWDTNTSGQPTSDGGTGITTAEMKRISTFANWGFIESWGIIENQTYPYLMTDPTGDLNHDKKVDFADFAILAENWLSGD